MPSTLRARRRARNRPADRKLASGPSPRNVTATRRRPLRSCRSGHHTQVLTRGCTVGVSVARYYDPQTAQFLTRDPIEALTGQPYQYADGDPVDGSDPSGLFCVGPVCVGFDPSTIPNSVVNIFRGASFGLTDRIANWISPGASCTVPQNYAQQLVGFAATLVATYGLGAASKAEGPEGYGPGTPRAGQPPDPATTVSDLLKNKLGSIRRAPLPPGSPSWGEIEQMTLNEIRAGAQANQPGYKTILKLLTDGRFNK